MAQNEGNNLSYFVAGAIIGAVAALLFTPKSGSQTRKLIGQKTEEGLGGLTDSGKELFDQGKDLYERGRKIADDAAEFFERGRKLVRG